MVVLAAALERVYRHCPSLTAHTIDTYTGTSSGAILACMLALGWTPREVLDRMAASASALHPPVWHTLVTMGGLLAPAYRVESVRSWLEGVFGTKTLHDLPRRVVVTAYDMAAGRSVLHHNLAPAPPGMPRETVVEILLRSCAAPVLMPLHRRHMDGAIFAPNPAAHASLLCQSVLGVPAHSLRVLSVGTLTQPRSVPSRDRAGALWFLLHPRAVVHHVYRSLLRSTELLMDSLVGPARWRRVEIHIPRSALRRVDSRRGLERLRAAGWDMRLPGEWIAREFCAGGRTSTPPSGANIF